MNEHILPTHTIELGNTKKFVRIGKIVARAECVRMIEWNDSKERARVWLTDGTRSEWISTKFDGDDTVDHALEDAV